MDVEGLRRILEDEEGVVLGYLFGSHAAGLGGLLSDLDVAVLLDGRLIKAERFKLRLKLMRKLSSRLRADRVDVIVMNDAPVTLKYEIIKHGKTLVVKEDEIKLEAESKILSTYLDRIYYERRSLNEFLERVIERGEL